MLIETKDYGFKAYIVLKYDGVITKDGVRIKEDITIMELLKEYNNSPYSTYNDILKQIIKDK